MRGTPVKCNAKIIKKAWEYANGGWEKTGKDEVPTQVGLALFIKTPLTTCRYWAKRKDAEDLRAEFSTIFDLVGELQHQRLVSKGLKGEYNAPIAKMMLTKHGYSDAVKQEHSGGLNITGIDIVMVRPE